MIREVRSIADIVRRAESEAPAALGVLEVGDGRRRTFGELHRRSSQLAQALQAAGVGPQDRVVVVGRNSIELVEIAFAASKLNAILVPVNWRLAPRELEEICDDADPATIFVDRDAVSGPFPWSTSTGSKRTVVVVGPHHGSGLAYEELIRLGAPVDPEVPVVDDDVALMLYTSGTTGRPKGVMLANHSFVAKTEAFAAAWGIRRENVVAAVMPMCHVTGFCWVFLALFQGCQVVLHRSVESRLIVQSIGRERITHLLVVPTVLRQLVDAVQPHDDLASLELIVYGASPVSPSLLERALCVLGSGFIQGYGLTETTGAVTMLDPTDHALADGGRLLSSCGRAFPWVELRVVDTSSGEDVPPGATGEIWTRSFQNMAGYWRNDAATSEVLNDGWLRTGDAGCIDADGYVYLRDRVKDMIVSGGENVYPSEVEIVLARHPGVADVAVVGVPDETWGEAVTAVVVARSSAELAEAELQAFVRESLAGYKVPKSVHITNELPRNASGKVLKRELRALYT